jgi:hypothetical protein
MTNAETNDTAATGAEQGAHGAPEKATSKKGATQKKGTPKAKKTAKAAKPKRKPRLAKRAPSPNARPPPHGPRARARRSWR